MGIIVIACSDHRAPRTRDTRLTIAAAFLTLFIALPALPMVVHGQVAEVPEPTAATRRSLVARRTAQPIRIDGRLDEPAWRLAPVASDFAQVRQDYVPTTRFPSEVRILFDDEQLYVGAFNRDSAGLSSLRMQDLRRDFEASESDVFGITVGSLGDGRTAFQFQTSPLGSQADVQAFDGGDQSNFNWDALWRVRTTRSDSGWFAEFAIPWRSMRYVAGLSSWDLNLVRNTRRALQWSAWSPYPRQFSSWRLTYAGTLDSLAPPPPRANIRVRPYVLGQSTRDNGPGAFSGSTGDVGGEIIWAPTASSLLEATVNTDFAQADVDRQVVNLTRFSVFFPEQRKFFLENSDLLNAGGLSGRYVMQPFFTRRIGLSDAGAPIPIQGGARYAYRTGRTTAGAMVMQQAAAVGSPSALFGVARGSQFFGRSTRIGATAAVRRDGGDDTADPASTTRPRSTNVVTAVDAITRIGEKIQLSGTLSTSTESAALANAPASEDLTGFAATYFVGRESPRLYTGILGAWVTRDYAPRTGFVSRANVFLTSPAISWTAQPRWRPASVVWFKSGVTTYFYQDPSSMRLQEGIITSSLEVLLRNGATIRPYLNIEQQRPDRDVQLFANVRTPAGRHDTRRIGADAKTDQSAQLAATANISTGGFFDGQLHRTAVSGRWSPNPYIALRANYEMNAFRALGARDTAFVTHLAGPELRVFASPRVQWSAFYQYNTVQQRGALNARFSWEFTPLSFVHVVYNDLQPIQGTLAPGVQSLIVKLSWLRQM